MFRIFVKILKWTSIGFVVFILLLGVIEFIADKFFDNAAKKDSCADSGGAWDYKRDACQYHPNDPRSKRQ
ncbi:MAG: hypothetical protein EOO68_11260 [Moraxellaceae bacterium]|nr:MAG: hypothetical protein EOO68_11260 [Moraxellaceae bacterium]